MELLRAGYIADVLLKRSYDGGPFGLDEEIEGIRLLQGIRSLAGDITGAGPDAECMANELEALSCQKICNYVNVCSDLTGGLEASLYHRSFESNNRRGGKTEGNETIFTILGLKDKATSFCVEVPVFGILLCNDDSADQFSDFLSDSTSSDSPFQEIKNLHSRLDGVVDWSYFALLLAPHFDVNEAACLHRPLHASLPSSIEENYSSYLVANQPKTIRDFLLMLLNARQMWRSGNSLHLFSLELGVWRQPQPQLDRSWWASKIIEAGDDFLRNESFELSKLRGEAHWYHDNTCLSVEMIEILSAEYNDAQDVMDADKIDIMAMKLAHEKLYFRSARFAQPHHTLRPPGQEPKYRKSISREALLGAVSSFRDVIPAGFVRKTMLPGTCCLLFFAKLKVKLFRGFLLTCSSS